MRLLQRSTRKLSLTEEGRRIYDRVRALPRVLEETVAIATQERPAGRVSITATHDVGASQLAPCPDELSGTLSGCGARCHSERQVGWI